MPDDRVRAALARDYGVIDITTTGRRSGRPSRIETWFHNIDGRVYLTGTPGPRDWYANLVANPDFTFHVKDGVEADLPAHARPITTPDERHAVFTRILANLDRVPELDAWLERSPLVAVTLG